VWAKRPPHRKFSFSAFKNSGFFEKRMNHLIYFQRTQAFKYRRKEM
jgi:hypothetical protein